MRSSSWKTAALAVVVAFGCASDAPANPSQVIATMDVQVSASSLTVGQTAQARATLLDGAGRSSSLDDDTVDWSTSNDAVAAISASGLVTAVSPGNAVITGAFQGKSARATVSVT